MLGTEQKILYSCVAAPSFLVRFNIFNIITLLFKKNMLTFYKYIIVVQNVLRGERIFFAFPMKRKGVCDGKLS